MKKWFSLFLALLLCICMIAVSFAEEASAATEEEAAAGGSQFERVLLQKGTLLKKEFVDAGTFVFDPTENYYDREVGAQTAVLTDMTTGLKYYALRLSYKYYVSKYDSGTKYAVLDMDEIDSVIATLNSLKIEFAGNVVDYTEYVYESNSGLKLGAYYSGGKSKLYIQFSSSVIARIDFTKIDEEIKFFENAKAALLAKQ